MTRKTDKIITVTAAAAQIGRSERTIRDWISHPENPLPAQQPTPGGPYLIRVADLEAYQPQAVGAPGGPIRSGKYEYWRIKRERHQVAGGEYGSRVYHVIPRGDAEALDALRDYHDANQTYGLERTTRKMTIADAIRTHGCGLGESELFDGVSGDYGVDDDGLSDSDRIARCCQASANIARDLQAIEDQRRAEEKWRKSPEGIAEAEKEERRHYELCALADEAGWIKPGLEANLRAKWAAEDEEERKQKLARLREHGLAE